MELSVVTVLVALDPVQSAQKSTFNPDVTTKGNLGECSILKPPVIGRVVHSATSVDCNPA